MTYPQDQPEEHIEDSFHQQDSFLNLPQQQPTQLCGIGEEDEGDNRAWGDRAVEAGDEKSD